MPSKGRADKLTTLKYFPEAYIFVDPQDEKAYFSYKNLVVLPKDNQGIGYVRKFIVDYFSSERYLLMPDDDIVGFYKREDSKLKKLDDIKEMIAEMLEELKNSGQVGLSTKDTNWYIKEDLIFNKKMFNFGLFNLEKMRANSVNYDESFTLYEDIDLLLQFLTKGVRTAVFHKYAVDTWSYKNRKNAGGCEKAWN